MSEQTSSFKEALVKSQQLPAKESFKKPPSVKLPPDEFPLSPKKNEPLEKKRVGLEELFNPRVDFQRINGLLHNSRGETESYIENPEAAAQHVKQGCEQFLNGEVRANEAADRLIAYLLVQNRASLAEGEFKPEIERHQIQGILRLLSGQSIHMGMGEGKSKVVFPIATIVQAIFSPDKKAVLASVNDTLVQKLTNNVNDYLQKLNGLLPDSLKVNLVPVKPSPAFSPLVTKKSALDILSDQLSTDQTSPQNKQILQDEFWADNTSEDQAQQDFFNNQSPRPQIFLFKERELVFTYNRGVAEEVRKSGVIGLYSPVLTYCEKWPTIFFDEAHVPYDRGTPYTETEQARFLSKEEFFDSACTWINYYCLYQQLNPKTYFEFYEGEYQLTKAAEEKIIQINLGRVKKDDAVFDRGAKLVFEELQRMGIIHPQRYYSFRNSLFHEFKNRLISPGPPPNDPDILNIDQQENLSMAQTLANMYGQVGRGYLYDQKGDQTPIVRDQYLGTLLENNVYSLPVQTAIQAIFSRFLPLSTIRKSKNTTHYSTFVADMGEKLRCGSGSLWFFDPISGKPKEGSFASLLRETTGKEVFLISPLDSKKPPVPEFFSNVSEIPASGKSELVVCWDENTARQLVQHYQKTFGQETVAFLSSDATSEEEERLYKELADGKIKILVSSGRAGVGADIKNSNGRFPDLHVTLVNLPLSRLQLTQALGRRRAEGNDFSWHIDRPSLERAISFLKNQSNIIGGFDPKHAFDELEKSKNDPARRSKLALNLIERIELARMVEDKTIVSYDRLFRVTLVPLALQRLREKIVSDRFPISDSDFYTEFFHLHENLYHKLYSRISTITDASDTNDLVQNKLTHKLLHDGELNAIIDDWYEARKQAAFELYSDLFDEGKLKEVMRLDLNEECPSFIVVGDNVTKDVVFRKTEFVPVSDASPGLSFGYVVFRSNAGQEERFFAVQQTNEQGETQLYVTGDESQDKETLTKVKSPNERHLQAFKSGRFKLRPIPGSEKTRRFLFYCL